ncbi:Putative odorant receptor 85d [Harpegnathos saltator]|uniref:Putative odorant receptor 85d n=1 Tax=Harpegnathos saltator TaxID=610380 RepID=E2B440_HARSA|nr:Putative odorant receptor 85d [Harpegnathos saltator]
MVPHIYASNFIKTYRFAVNDYLTVEDAEQRAIMLRHSFTAKTFMCSMVLFSYYDATIYMITPYLGSLISHQSNVTQEDVELEYALPSRCALEYLNAPQQNMYATYCIIELIMMLFVMKRFVYPHCAAYLRPSENPKIKFISFDITAPQIYDRLHMLIQRHDHLIAMTRLLADAVSFILLVQLFVSSLLLCTLGFQVVMALKVNNISMTLKSFMVLNGCLVQITIYCAVEDYLKSQMEESIIVILPSIEIYLGCNDAESNVDALMLIVCGLLAMAKMIWFRIHASNLVKTYKFAVNDYLAIESAEQRDIMLKHAFIAKTLMCIMVSVAYSDSCILFLISILGNSDNVTQATNVTQHEVILGYTVPSRCALEYLNAPRNMHVTHCIIELIMLLLVCTSNYGNDSLFLHIALHICAQVKILKSNLIDFDFMKPQINKRFNALIQRHGDLMEMTKILSNVVSFILLMQLFLSSILLCILGFQLILALKLNNFAMLVKSFMILNTFLAQITIYCVIGDYLKSQMEEVGTFIYQSTWYNLPAKLTKSLSFIIMRSQFPVQLQAGNFIVVNLATYMSILKTSISYLSVLRVMVET